MKRFEEYLAYSPQSGKLYWIKPFSNASRVKYGDIAGARRMSGYKYVCLGGRVYLAHRVAWYLKTGKWPDHDIDHKDGNRGNNCWENLRAATDSQNQANKKLSRNNTSGHKGVSWHTHYRKYVASVEVNGKAIWLGAHETKELAAEAYAAAAKRYFGEYARP